MNMFEGIDLSKININEIINQFQGIDEDSKKENNELIFTSKTGGGMVEISINGNNEVIDLKIEDSLLQDKDSLKILLISAITDIIKQSEDNKKTVAINMMEKIKPFMKK